MKKTPKHATEKHKFSFHQRVVSFLIMIKNAVYGHLSMHKEFLKKKCETQWKTDLSHDLNPQAGNPSKAEKIVKFISIQTANGHLLILKIIGGFLVTFIFWACFFHINEIVKAQGDVISSKHVQKMGSLEGGIVTKIYVKEGEKVQENQILLTLDPTENIAKRVDFERAYFRNLATAERLKAHISNISFTPTKELYAKFPDFVRQEEEAFKNAKDRLEQSQTTLNEEVNSKTHQMKQAKERLKFAEKQLPVVLEQYKITDTLFKKGLYSKLKNLDVEKQKIDMEKEVATLKEQIPGLEADINQAKSKLLQTHADFINQCQRELKDAETKMDDEKSNQEITENKIKNQEIHAKISGIVKELNAKTVGGVVRPGEDILTLVPSDDALLIEARVMPGDIGFIHPGQTVSIKITTFDFTIFGRLKGVVESVSPDAMQDKQEHSYFKVTIRAEHNFLEQNGHKMYISSGMGADLDIEINRHSVMSFILKPVLKGFQGAMSER